MDQQLLNRIKQCESLPTLPAVAVQILELVRDPKTEIPQLARLISKDPALASKILRVVNSSMYSRPRKISRLTQALALLGLQSVRILTLGFSLVRNLKNHRNRGFRPLDYWRRSVYTAAAALTLAQHTKFELQEEAFVAGLLMDLGMLVLDELYGEQYNRLNEKARTHGDLVRLEEATFQTTHAEVGGLLAQLWNIPAVLAVPIALHHTPEGTGDSAHQALACICRLSGKCADMFVEESSTAAAGEFREGCRIHYGMTGDDCDALLDRISRRTSEIASLFDLAINTGVNSDTILKRANDSVIQLTLAAQEQARRERTRLQDQAALDPVTGLTSRGRFDSLLAGRFTAAPPDATPASLVMIEVDQFEQAVRRHGEPAGDAVMQAIAATLRRNTRPTDSAARFRERQFAVLLGGVGRAEAVAWAENIRREVAAHALEFNRASLSLTVTLGVAVHETGSPFREPAHLIRAAEAALEAAEEAGHNCVRAFALGKFTTGPVAA